MEATVNQPAATPAEAPKPPAWHEEHQVPLPYIGMEVFWHPGANTHHSSCKAFVVACQGYVCDLVVVRFGERLTVCPGVKHIYDPQIRDREKMTVGGWSQSVVSHPELVGLAAKVAGLSCRLAAIEAALESARNRKEGK